MLSLPASLILWLHQHVHSAFVCDILCMSHVLVPVDVCIFGLYTWNLELKLVGCLSITVANIVVLVMEVVVVLVVLAAVHVVVEVIVTLKLIGDNCSGACCMVKNGIV